MWQSIPVSGLLQQIWMGNETSCVSKFDALRPRQADTALRLARYFGGDAESWLNLQQMYDLKMASTGQLQKALEQIQPLATDALVLV